VLAFATGCKDRDRDDTASRIENTADETTAEARDGAADVGDATRAGTGAALQGRDEHRTG